MKLALFLLLLPLAAPQEPSPSPTTPPAPEVSPPAAPAEPSDAPRVAGRDVPWPKRVKSVTPAYPPEAQAIGQRGIVILQLLVGTDGKVVSVEVTRSVPPFDEPALAAVRQWEYEVTRVDGRPVSVLMNIPITFALKLPEMKREAGIPELRQGVAPVFPPGPAQDARVKARLVVDGQGQVREATITSGSSPWSEAVLQAVRTWSFVPPADGAPLSFDVEASFEAGTRPTPAVALDLSGIRRLDAAEAARVLGPTAAPLEPSEPARDPAALPSARTPDEVAAPPAGASPPPAGTPAAPRAPATTTPSATPPPADSTAPTIEVVPAPPAPSPAPVRRMDSASTESGVSAVRDVVLAAGVPDLTSGRRPLVPPLARMEGVTGQVEVRFIVESSGATSNLEIGGAELLKEAARQTVSSWTFRRASTERLFLVAVIEYGGETARATVQKQS